MLWDGSMGVTLLARLRSRPVSIAVRLGVLLGAGEAAWKWSTTALGAGAFWSSASLAAAVVSLAVASVDAMRAAGLTPFVWDERSRQATGGAEGVKIWRPPSWVHRTTGLPSAAALAIARPAPSRSAFTNTEPYG